MNAIIKFPKLTLIIRFIYSLFLLGIGIITVLMALKGKALTSDMVGNYISAVMASFIYPWMGIIKIIVGLLIFIPRTSALGILFAFPYAFNNLLWVTFAVSALLPLGILDFLFWLYLIYAYWNVYKTIINIRL